MLYLGAILLSIALFAGFLVLASHESRRGTRYFEEERSRLDAFVHRLQFIFEHVDFASFLRHLFISTAETVAHEIVRLILLGVRALERFLTRTVRYLRLRRAVPLENVAAPASPFVETIATFKHRLRKERNENIAAELAAEASEPEVE